MRTATGGLLVAKNGPLSNSIAAIQENYTDSIAHSVAKPQQYSVKKLSQQNER